VSLAILLLLRRFHSAMRARRTESTGSTPNPSSRRPIAMGVTTLVVDVANPASPENVEHLECAVDSGAVYSVVPAAVLERLGIRPLKRDTFRLANGAHVERQRGGAVFRFGDYVGVAAVIFGEEGDATRLGALTLETLGLVLDPIRRELKPMELIQ